MPEKAFVKTFSVSPQIFSSMKKFLRLLQNRVQAIHLFLKGDDLGWGAPGLGDDLGWAGEATRDAQGCGGGPPPLGLLERDISSCMSSYPDISDRFKLVKHRDRSDYLVLACSCNWFMLQAVKRIAQI